MQDGVTRSRSYCAKIGHVVHGVHSIHVHHFGHVVYVNYRVHRVHNQYIVYIVHVVYVVYVLYYVHNVYVGYDLYYYIMYINARFSTEFLFSQVLKSSLLQLVALNKDYSTLINSHFFYHL